MVDTAAEPRSILPAGMISVEEARARILQVVDVLPAVDAALDPTATGALPGIPASERQGALGLVLAEDVVAGFAIPPLANTSMDGYAVRADDTRGATYGSPRTLRVIGYLPAGAVFEGVVGPGEALRIMTGAPMPAGADAIVPFEETDEYDAEGASADSEALTPTLSHQVGEGAGDGGRGRASWQDAPREVVRIDVEARPEANVRPAGEDVRPGEVVLRAGTMMGPAQIGVAASLGLDRVRAHRRPVVAVLSTGDELLRPGEPLAPGKIYDANAYSIAALVRAWGGVPRILDVATDTIEALTARIREGIAGADLLVTTAGVSRGDFDVVKTVLAREGEVGFWTVNMKPGKPLAFGVFHVDAHPSDGGASARRVPHLGLPGNPVSAMMTFELFGRPALFKMLGRLQHDADAWQRPTVRATALEAIRNGDGRRFYARCIAEQDRDGRWHVRLTGPQGSGVLTSMSLANAYAVLPEGEREIPAGAECDVMLVDREQPPRPPPPASAPGA